MADGWFPPTDRDLFIDLSWAWSMEEDVGIYTHAVGYAGYFFFLFQKGSLISSVKIWNVKKKKRQKI